MLKELRVLLNFLKVNDTPFVVKNYACGCRDTLRIGVTIFVYRKERVSATLHCNYVTDQQDSQTYLVIHFNRPDCAYHNDW
jgi:hypothetical protein